MITKSSSESVVANAAQAMGAMQYPSVQLDVTLDDIHTLSYIKTLLKQMKGVRSVSVKSVPKVKMSKEEFHAKIDASLANTSKETSVSMGQNETGEQFLKRVLTLK